MDTSNRRTLGLVFITLLVAVAGCGKKASTTCSREDATTCTGGQVCETVAGMLQCSTPLVVKGKVTNLAGAGIEGALVSGLDANDAPMTNSTKTDATGSFTLSVSTPRAGSDGAPAARALKLRAAASGFDTFPSGIRRSLPIELSTAVSNGTQLVVENAATTIVLLDVSGANLGSIAGTVKGPAGKSGALIVAEGPSTVTGISDSDGAYVLFNVPAGSYTVRGYAADLALSPAMATVSGGMRASPVDLVTSGKALAQVSGSVNIVNPGEGKNTSVVLVVESTFNDKLKRGEVPPGLRAPRTGEPSISGAFTIEGVPEGSYVVLAAFENDALVRDPDTNISGTQIQHITVVAGAMMSLSASFKVTGALKVISPGAADKPDEVSGTPTFRWVDDSSEDGYIIEVFDQLGNTVWSDVNVPGVSGGDVSVVYAGPALVSGAYYQFRATSWRKAMVPISQTEDLRGVFIAKN